MNGKLISILNLLENEKAKNTPESLYLLDFKKYKEPINNVIGTISSCP